MSWCGLGRSSRASPQALTSARHLAIQSHASPAPIPVSVRRERHPLRLRSALHPPRAFGPVEPAAQMQWGHERERPVHFRGHRRSLEPRLGARRPPCPRRRRLRQQGLPPPLLPRRPRRGRGLARGAARGAVARGAADVPTAQRRVQAHPVQRPGRDQQPHPRRGSV